jgi:hypothetical protein
MFVVTNNLGRDLFEMDGQLSYICASFGTQLTSGSNCSFFFSTSELGILTARAPLRPVVCATLAVSEREPLLVGWGPAAKERFDKQEMSLP